MRGRFGDVLSVPEISLRDYLKPGIPLIAVTFMPAMAFLSALWPVTPAAAP